MLVEQYKGVTLLASSLLPLIKSGFQQIDGFFTVSTFFFATYLFFLLHFIFLIRNDDDDDSNNLQLSIIN